MNNKFKDRNFINALLYISFGALFCIFRAQLIGWALTAIGVVCIVAGISNIINGNQVEGIVTAAIGLLLILGGWLFLEIILLIFGIIILLKGILELINAVKVRNVNSILAAAISTAVGVMLIISKWILIDWLFIIIGVILIIDGVMLLLDKKK